MRFVVATHGHCFDGLASATLFTRLLADVGGAQTAFAYRACGYGLTQQRADEALLDGDQNAILDYRFCPCDKLTWYFDHHRTAFASPADRQVFEARKSGSRYYFDPSAGSCTKLIAEVGEHEFGVRYPELDDLIHWADLVDTARFVSPDAAIDRNNAVLRLVSVTEHHGDDAFLGRMVPRLLERPLEEVAALPEVEQKYRPLHDKHQRFVERVRARGEARGRVVYVDLTDAVLDSVGKFVTYALYPTSVYSVIVSLLKSGPKIAVGYNPWCGVPLDVDVSAICSRYGGGGHSVVGGIAFSNKEVERARKVALDIVEELNGA
jgi:hypothetical protein